MMSSFSSQTIPQKTRISMGFEGSEDSYNSNIVISDLHNYIETSRQLSDIPEENDNDPQFKCCSIHFKQEIFKSFQLGVPLMVTNLLQFFLIIETTAFVGRLSSVELEGTGLALSLIQALGWFVLSGMVSACDTMMSQTYGSQNKRRTGLFLQRGLLLMNLLPFLLYGIHINFEPILIGLGQDPDVARVTTTFSMYFIPGLTFMLNYLLLARYMQNQNATKVPIIAALLGNVFNVSFQSIFVIYLGYGYKASAISLNLSYFIMMLTEALYIVFSKFYIPTWPGFQWEAFYDWKQMFQLGLAGMAHTTFECFVWEGGVFLGGLLGTTQLATNSILIQFVNTMFLVSFGAGSASNIRVGQFLGSNRPNQAKTAYRAGFTVIAIISSILATICVIFHRYVAYLFTNQQDVIDMVSDTFPYVFAILYTDPFSAVCIGSIRGCGKQKIGAILVFISMYIFALPIGVLLSFVVKIGVKGIWIGISVGSLVSVASNLSILECQSWYSRAEEAQKRITYSSLKAEIDVSAETQGLLTTNLEISDEDDHHESNPFNNDLKRKKKPVVHTYHVRTPSNPIFCSTEIIPIPPPKSTAPGFSWKIVLKRLFTFLFILLILLSSVLIYLLLDPAVYRSSNSSISILKK